MRSLKRFSFISYVILMIGIIGGSLFANIYCMDDVSKWGVFDLLYLEKMQRIHVVWTDLFRYVCGQRMKLWGLVLLLKFTMLKELLAPILIMGLGFFWGMEVSCYVAIHGIKGIGYFFILCLITQGIYGWGLLISVRGISRKNDTTQSYGIIQGKKQLILVQGKIPHIVVAGVLIIFSAMLESLINVYFLKLL